MDKLVYLLPALGCAAMMGMMMWMMRGQHGAAHPGQKDSTGPDPAEEIALLRAEVAVLRAQQRTHPAEQSDTPR